MNSRLAEATNRRSRSKAFKATPVFLNAMPQEAVPVMCPPAPLINRNAFSEIKVETSIAPLLAQTVVAPRVRNARNQQVHQRAFACTLVPQAHLRQVHPRHHHPLQEHTMKSHPARQMSRKLQSKVLTATVCALQNVQVAPALQMSLQVPCFPHNVCSRMTAVTNIAPSLACSQGAQQVELAKRHLEDCSDFVCMRTIKPKMFQVLRSLKVPR